MSIFKKDIERLERAQMSQAHDLQIRENGLSRDRPKEIDLLSLSKRKLSNDLGVKYFHWKHWNSQHVLALGDCRSSHLIQLCRTVQRRFIQECIPASIQSWQSKQQSVLTLPHITSTHFFLTSCHWVKWWDSSSFDVFVSKLDVVLEHTL